MQEKSVVIIKRNGIDPVLGTHHFRNTSWFWSKILKIIEPSEKGRFVFPVSEFKARIIPFDLCLISKGIKPEVILASKSTILWGVSFMMFIVRVLDIEVGLLVQSAWMKLTVDHVVSIIQPYWKTFRDAEEITEANNRHRFLLFSKPVIAVLLKSSTLKSLLKAFSITDKFRFSKLTWSMYSKIWKQEESIASGQCLAAGIWIKPENSF